MCGGRGGGGGGGGYYGSTNMTFKINVYLENCRM